MAYTAGTLALDFLGGPGGAREYTLVTTDSLATVSAADYFLADYLNLRVGDLIKVIVVDAVAPSSRTSVTNRFSLSVTAASSTTVTTATTSGSAGSVIATTAGATALTITAATHSDKIVTLNNTAPITVTLPAASGSGAKFRFWVGVAATGTASKIQVANATDVMAGYQFTVTTTSTNVEGFATSATSDTYSMNGTTQGGIVGDLIEIIDVKAGVFSVMAYTSSTGTEATPFSAAVS